MQSFILLAISAAIVGILTCNQTEVKLSIAKHSTTLAKLIPLNKKYAEKFTCYLVYALIALTIAAPGAAIVATNVNADMAGPTATVVRSSGYLPLQPMLELTLTETVELDYRPDNYATSMVVGVLLVAGTIACVGHVQCDQNTATQ